MTGILWRVDERRGWAEEARLAMGVYMRRFGRAAQVVVVPPGTGLRLEGVEVREARWCLRGHLLAGVDDEQCSVSSNQ
jgi:hypothetical protein